MSDTGVNQTYAQDRELWVLGLILRAFGRLSRPGQRWLVARLSAELKGK